MTASTALLFFFFVTNPCERAARVNMRFRQEHAVRRAPSRQRSQRPDSTLHSVGQQQATPGSPGAPRCSLKTHVPNARRERVCELVTSRSSQNVSEQLTKLFGILLSGAGTRDSPRAWPFEEEVLNSAGAAPAPASCTSSVQRRCVSKRNISNQEPRRLLPSRSEHAKIEHPHVTGFVGQKLCELRHIPKHATMRILNHKRNIKTKAHSNDGEDN